MTEIFLFFLAFWGGIVAFISPCNVVALPSFISYVGSQANTVKKSILMSLVFSVGFSTMFAILSTLFIFLTGFIRYTFWLKWFSGVIIIALAIYVFFSKRFFKMKPAYNLVNDSESKDFEKKDNLSENINSKTTDNANYKRQGYTGSFMLGFSLGYSWIACITPIYFSIVIIVSNQANLLLGLLVFFVYALGIMIPFVIIGALIGSIKKRFLVQLIKVGSKVQKIFALILLYVGVELLLSAYGIPGLLPFI
ncbi:MAG: cytochrome c biogenesis protein CcdA [Candidatus Lokiarchaeota archaeon]|nr:cytochrome c biogenesis protein CcdA [Candidatus Lokiarchaeota archaeon]